MKKKSNIQNKEQIIQNLKKILEDIHTKEDELLLTEYRKLFKKHVSWFSRSYVAAYFLKRYLSNYIASDASNQSTQYSNKNRKQTATLNIGSSRATEKEIYEFLLSLPDITESDFSIVKQTHRHTQLSINKQTVSKLLSGIKTNKFKEKKLFINLYKK